MTALADAAEQLIRRIDRELQRARRPTPSTERVGGWAKLGGCFDTLMRAAVVEIAAAMKQQPDALVARHDPKLRLERAAAGQLARVLRALARDAAPRPDRLAALLDDLGAQRSAVIAAINARNGAVHEPGGEPSAERTAALLPPVRAVVAAMIATPDPPKRRFH